MGGQLDYEHRVTQSLSLFGEGWAGLAEGPGGWQPDFGAMAGARWRF